MCGIAGMVAWRPVGEPDRQAVRAMNGALVHRGPDGEGWYEDDGVLLAMRRLSIIDLQGGWQPLYNEDRSVALVANGEIYNYVELRRELEQRGHTFRTGSDCETIVHLYEERGRDAVLDLRGMFAFALWDVRERRLLLARDRMGEKPLFLARQKDRLLFASELKALLASGAVPFELDPGAVQLFLHYQYVPEPGTALKGVVKLPPATVLEVEAGDGAARETTYWRMEDAPPIDDDPAEVLRERLDEVSRLIIRSDVPVGIALSGGLDSGVVAALTARTSPERMHTFSVGYAGRPPCDERDAAREIADHLGMPFHDVELSAEGFQAFFPELMRRVDEPIADFSGYGYHAVMKLAREHGVKVLMQGQGGDELFWGYPWLRDGLAMSREKAALLDRGWSLLPHYLAPPRRRTNPAVWLRWLAGRRGLRDSLASFRRLRGEPPDRVHGYDLLSDFGRASAFIERVCTPGFAAGLDRARPWEPLCEPRPHPPLDVLLTRLACRGYLMCNGIAQGDRYSMASSIELRLPLVDHRFVEAVIGLRKARPDGHLPGKQRFREAVEPLVPPFLLQRRKRGFEAPVVAWLAPLYRRYREELTRGRLVDAGILNPAAVGDLDPTDGDARTSTPFVFKLLVLEQWCRAVGT